MRRCISADSLIKVVLPKNQNEQKILPILIKSARSREFNKYKTCVLISGTLLMSYYTISNDYSFEILGVMFTSGYFSINLCFSYINNYLTQMDIWREEEAQYEYKRDPPKWNWKIINYTNHLSIIFNLLACLTELNDSYYYLATVFQFVSFCLRIHNDYKSTKNLIISFMDFTSIILFAFNRYSGNNILLISSGTYLTIISELISL
jgi:hypothetical protein